MEPQELPVTPYQTPYRRGLLAVGLLSGGAVALAVAGTLLTRRAQHFYLLWNLFLALLPLGFSLWAHRAWSLRGPTAALLPASLWLLFLPNSPYILTDFIHLTHTDPRWVWGHLLLLVWFSSAGLFSGLLSLRILHHRLAEFRSPALAWTSVAAVSMLTGIGVALGRFERWNSWDAFRNPTAVAEDILHRLTPGAVSLQQALLPWALGLFFALAYLVLWALATDPSSYSGMVSAGGSGRKKDNTKPSTYTTAPTPAAV